MTIVAIRQLKGSYGLLAPGDIAEVNYELAHHLIKRGLAYEYGAKPAYEVKVISSIETKPVTSKTRKRRSRQAE
jgi:hypothetical protein